MAQDKEKESNRVFLTFEEAEAMLPEGDTIHTFASSTGMIIGADWSRESVLELLRTGEPELAGDMATSMGHGIVAFLKVDKDKSTKGDARFIKTKE